MKYEYAWAHLGVDSLSEMGKKGWRVVPIPPVRMPADSTRLCMLMERATD